MKKLTIRALLAVLNSRLLNQTPCRFGFIGNIDTFSYEELSNEEKQQPGITVREVLEVADRFRSCPMRKDGLAVIEGDEIREATVWDMQELRDLK